MTHPHNLHAAAALWSYQRAAAELHRAVNNAALEAPDGLRSTTYGTRHPTAGHGDPVLTLIITGRPADRLSQLANSTTSTLTWLANHVAPGTGNPTARLAAAIPTLPPTTASHIARWVAEADQRIRHELGLPPDEQTLPGNPRCPSCRQRLLRVQTSAPDPTAWTATCGASCACLGDRCRCGMPTRIAGVEHIWRRTDLFTALRISRRLATA